MSGPGILQSVQCQLWTGRSRLFLQDSNCLICTRSRPERGTNHLLFAEYWVLSLAVTRRCLRIITNLKLKTSLTARYVRGKVRGGTSRIHNGAEQRLNNIVVSATPTPTASPIRSQIASHSQQLLRIGDYFALTCQTFMKTVRFFETSDSLNPATRRHSNLKINAVGTSSFRILAISGPHSEGQTKAQCFRTRNLFHCLAVKCPSLDQTN